MSRTAVETATDTPAGFDEAAFEAFLETRDEPEWVTGARRAAFAIFQEKQANPLDPEEFKRVDLRTFRPEAFAVSSKPHQNATFDTLLRSRAEFAGHVSHVDGHSTDADLEQALSAKGVLFGDLAALVREEPNAIKPHLLTRAVTPQTNRFSAWHAAFWTGGTVLYVPAGVEIDVPLYSLIALSAKGVADFSHTLVIVEEGASATLLEETASADADSPGLHVGAVELLIDRAARLQYVQIQNWNGHVCHFAHQVGRVESDGSLGWTVGGIGSRLAHIRQEVSLDGRGAEAEVNGVSFAADRQLLSYYTQQTHNAPQTRSDLLHKQVLRDRSRAVWRGMIRVEPEAQLTDSYQRSDALLLNSTCRSDAIPGLEIEADDVRCTHGATAGRVDEEQIFYLMCRGLARDEAMQMIVEGFFHGVYDRVPVEAVRETLSAAVEQRLSGWSIPKPGDSNVGS